MLSERRRVSRLLSRSPSEDENHSQETTESCRSCQSSLEMDCSEPYSDQTGESSTQEMTSASGSLESYMDYSEETEQNKEEENSNENNNNDINASNSPRRQNSLTVNVSSEFGSQHLSPDKESPSQGLIAEVHLNLEVKITSDSNVSTPQSNGLNSTSSRKRKRTDDDKSNMDKRREV
ncbi:uncharacterized protein LOC143804171 isoform X6 [Ranitomeya variabilis]|uniref:uncharacterized protein LOC143804171 isoform X6 n=1 Tax=Ranitomeya variabilis TaxID=490064 RepID=UPI0040562022